MKPSNYFFLIILFLLLIGITAFGPDRINQWLITTATTQATLDASPLMIDWTPFPHLVSKNTGLETSATRYLSGYLLYLPLLLLIAKASLQKTAIGRILYNVNGSVIDIMMFLWIIWNTEIWNNIRVIQDDNLIPYITLIFIVYIILTIIATAKEREDNSIQLISASI